VLADDCELLAGTIEDPAQAVVSRNRALVALARARATTYTHAPATSSEEAEIATDWLAWEADKQRRLRLLRGGSDVA
jgi:hypothetical protein